MTTDTQQAIREAFRSVGIQRVEFGNWNGDHKTPDTHDHNDSGETTSIALFTQNGHVEVEATPHGTLKITDHGV
jgi:hypothetical protein